MPTSQSRWIPLLAGSCFCALAACSVPEPAGPAATAAGQAWEVDFFDDFERFDPGNWQDQLLWVNDEDQCYVRDGLHGTREVSDGTLKLRVVDLGQPDRFMNVLLHPTLNSPMFWDSVVLLGYLLLNLTIGCVTFDAERRGECGEAGDTVALSLARILTDPDLDVRAEAAIALGLLRRGSADLLEPLEEGIREGAPSTRVRAIRALRRALVPTRQLLPVLRDALHDEFADDFGRTPSSIKA